MTIQTKGSDITKRCDAPKCKESVTVTVTAGMSFREGHTMLANQTARWVTTGPDHYCPRHQ